MEGRLSFHGIDTTNAPQRTQATGINKAGVQLETRTDAAVNKHTVKPITILPLDAMEAISFHLPPQSLVALSATSRHFKNMLSHDWLWRTQLQQKHPKWAVTPKNGGVWKELVVVATQLEALASYEICLDLHRRLKWQSTEDSGTQVGMPFRAGQGRAGQGRAGQGRAGQGRARAGRPGQRHGRAGQGRAGMAGQAGLQTYEKCQKWWLELRGKHCTRLHTIGLVPSNGHLLTGLGEAVVEEWGGAEHKGEKGLIAGGGVAGERRSSAQGILPDGTAVPDG
ncbi:MAG: hypothetical protein FRX49_10244 [Trebouxia sp. A1-2]|nr:MAG: hypothetical protein FRX49_10244 [Trebouxia sp. A1-2]